MHPGTHAAKVKFGALFLEWTQTKEVWQEGNEIHKTAVQTEEVWREKGHETKPQIKERTEE